MTISGKVAVVTGAGGLGCGRAIARGLARAGATVVVSDRNDPGAHETVRQIESAGGSAAAFPADIRSAEQTRALIEFATTLGPLGILVNNASAPFHPGEPLEHWEETIATDLLGAMYATRFAIDAMRRAGGGAIVNIGSTSALPHGHLRPTGSPAYDAAKAAVIRLTTTLASLSSENIRANCLAPGWIATPEVRTYWEAMTLERRNERGAPSRLLELDAVADAVLRLATDESLFGRVLVWWSEDSPRLIRWGDPGYDIGGADVW